MQTSEPGKTVYLDLSVWYDEERGSIHLAARNVEGFHTTVNNDPGSKRGHPNLFRKLAKCLRDAGVPHPDVKAE